MAQVMVNFRMDKELKEDMEKTCKEMGMSMTTAFTIFAKKVSREGRIPFEVCADPFYSKDNLERIYKSIKEIDEGKTSFHEIIEE